MPSERREAFEAVRQVMHGCVMTALFSVRRIDHWLVTVKPDHFSVIYNWDMKGNTVGS
jgi:hypothetical protein